MMRILIAHAKGEDAAEIDALVKEVQEASPGAEVIKASDEWQRSFSSLGSWGAWTSFVGGGRDVNGAPTYDTYVCPREYVGRATAQIIETALASGRNVILGRKGEFNLVSSIIVEDPDSWVAGWKLVTE
jgi:hypothetical protein